MIVAKQAYTPNTSMIKALRPGGRIVLEDDPHDTLRLWPEPPGFDLLTGAPSAVDGGQLRELSIKIHKSGGAAH